MNYIQDPAEVIKASDRIAPYIHKTPIIKSETLSDMLGHDIYFKAESLQKTGAFKVRGVLNHLLALREQGALPSKIVAYSTGNHGIGASFVSRILGIQARIYLPQDTSEVKQRAAKYYGSEVIYTKTRADAERLARRDAEEYGFHYLHPSDSDTTIAGAGTLCYEALQQLDFTPDAIFASCGGGGLLSGTYLAKELLAKNARLYGVEPLSANDAYISLQQKEIFRFSDSPETIADGLRTLSLSSRTFEYLKKIDELYLAKEDEIYYWTAWLIHLLKIACEPSSALNMSGLCQWLAKQNSRKTALILISGGNIDPSIYRKIWEENYLLTLPSIYR